MNRTLSIAAASALLLAFAASTADAQDRRKSNDRQREQQERQQSKSYSSAPSCNGGLFIIEDGGSATCSLPDGRRCTVRAGTSGYATVSDCK